MYWPEIPRAVDSIIEHEGAVIPDLTRLSGRRAELHLAQYHPDCAEAVRIREEKWDREEEMFGEFAREDTESEDEDESCSDEGDENRQ